MNNPRLAGRYAKSLLDLAIENKELETVYADVKYIKFLCRQNPDFVSLLRSPIIKGDKKEKIVQSVLSNSISKLTSLFINLLIRKTRENNLPEIASVFIEQYNILKNIHVVKITTAVPMSKEVEELLLSKIRENVKFLNLELEKVVNEDLIGGYRIEMGDRLIDSSVLRDLTDVKKQFMGNEYKMKLR